MKILIAQCKIEHCGNTSNPRPWCAVVAHEGGTRATKGYALPTHAATHLEQAIRLDATAEMLADQGWHVAKVSAFIPPVKRPLGEP